MSGAGNDFVVVDNRAGVVPHPANFARIVCDRRTGVGADGLLLLETHPRLAFTMRYYNADGSYGGMCGNGGRCISRFARLEAIAKTDSFSFEALGREYPAVIIGDRVKLFMGSPTDFRPGLEIEVLERKVRCHFINTGSPHCIVYTHENSGLLRPSFPTAEIISIGREMRRHPAFGDAGTNVNFVEVIDPTLLNLRTYERGVEDETLACGTGSVATALVSHAVLGGTSPTRVRVRSGEELVIEYERDGTSYRLVSLMGSAVVKFRGTMKFDFQTSTIADHT